jgi:hypothetical protein
MLPATDRGEEIHAFAAVQSVVEFRGAMIEEDNPGLLEGDLQLVQYLANGTARFDLHVDTSRVVDVPS